MDPNRHEVPKHHQERTWAIYGKSVPQLFLERAAARPESVALRYKDFGLYQEVIWRKYREDVEAFALGLISLGVAPRDRIAIMGDPCFEYFVADMAGLAAGAVTYGIYTTCSASEVRHQLENAEAKIFIAENQEYVDKVLELQNLATQLRHIIVADMRAMFLYRDERIVSFARDRKSTRLNSSHLVISYAVFCLKKKKINSVRNPDTKKVVMRPD